MATLKSAYITNATATPLVKTNAVVGAGILRESVGVVTPAADQADDTIMLCCRVPSNARISQLLISAADATTAGKVDAGVYETSENGGTVVDRDLFAAAYDLSGGPYSNADITHQSGEYTIAESEKMLWEVLGEASDPNKEYDIALTVETLFNGGPTSIGLKVRYTA
jgi:hypothetical protein